MVSSAFGLLAASTPDPPTGGGSLLALLSILVAGAGGIAALVTAHATRGSSAVQGFQALNAAIVTERDEYRAQSAAKDDVIDAKNDRIAYLEHILHTQHIDPALWAEHFPPAPKEGHT